MTERAFLTKEILDKAIDLYQNHRVGWADVADRLGVKHSSLKVAVCRYRKGEMRFKHQEVEDRWKKIERMVRKGYSTQQMADELGCHRASICWTLKSKGYDPAVRYEIAPFKTKFKPKDIDDERQLDRSRGKKRPAGSG